MCEHTQRPFIALPFGTTFPRLLVNESFNPEKGAPRH